MIDVEPQSPAFNVLAIVQDGRLAFEALLLLASFKANTPGFQGKVFLAEPQPGKRWNRDPRLKSDGISRMPSDFSRGSRFQRLPGWGSAKNILP